MDDRIEATEAWAELATVPAGVAPPVFELPLGSVFSVMRGAEDPKNRDVLYVVGERFTGGSLRDILDRGRLLSPSQALPLLRYSGRLTPQ